MREVKTRNASTTKLCAKAIHYIEGVRIEAKNLDLDTLPIEKSRFSRNADHFVDREDQSVKQLYISTSFMPLMTR